MASSSSRAARDEAGYDGGFVDDSDLGTTDNDLFLQGQRDTKRASALHVQPSDMEAFGAVAEHPEIQQRLLDLAHEALDGVEDIMRNGTVAAKAPYMRSMLAILTRPREEDTSSKDIEVLRAMVQQQNAELEIALLTRELPKAAPAKELTVDTSTPIQKR